MIPRTVLQRVSFASLPKALSTMASASCKSQPAAGAPLLALARVAKLCCRNLGMCRACHSDQRRFDGLSPTRNLSRPVAPAPAF
jgi:hypothetical protein